MNRRRTVKPQLGFGSIVMLVMAAVIMASAGVFHAYIKNRQVNVSREIQHAEERISQHEMDIKTNQMLLDEQLNRFLLRDRLREFNSDLRAIPIKMVREVDAHVSGPAMALGEAGVTGPLPPSLPDPPAPAGSPVAGLARSGP